MLDEQVKLRGKENQQDSFGSFVSTPLASCLFNFGCLQQAGIRVFN